MSDSPRFFLPPFSPEEQEEEYRQLAAACHCSIPSPRIYSITYRHDTDWWTATVGEQLEGSHTEQVGPRRNKTERTTRLNDPATVVAIFPGASYIVWTDYGAKLGAPTRWENPFLAGIPTSITYFSA